MKRVMLIPLFVLAFAAWGPCSDSSTGAPRLVDGVGVVGQGVAPECPTTWYITTADGSVYWPVDDPAFQHEGIRVRFTARTRPGQASACMVGTIVDLISIHGL